MKGFFVCFVTILLVISTIFCVVGCKEPETEYKTLEDGASTGNGGNTGNESGDINTQNYKYSKDLWGKWKQIDNGDIYTISGDSITTNGWNYENLNSAVINKEGENIITLENNGQTYRLFRTGGGTRAFTAKIAGFQDVTSRELSNSEFKGKGGVKVKRKSKDIHTDTDTQVSASDGTITFEDVVADEVQVITVETENGNTIEVELKPSYDGENVGTIPIVESGYSFKTTYTINDNQLYCFGNDFKEYDLTLQFANIGDTTCSTAVYEFLCDDPKLKLSQTSGVISSIGAGSSKDVNVNVTYGALCEYYKDVTIVIKITDSKLRKTWLDSITLRFYQTPVYLNLYAYNANKSGNLNGFVICPDGRAAYFNTWHDDKQIYKLVPYNKNGSNDCTVVFSATSEYDEMAYTLNAGYTNNDYSKHFDFEKYFANTSQLELFDFFDSYEDGQGNNTEDTAIEVKEPLDFVKSYVQWGDVDYFKLDLTNIFFARISEFKIPKAGLGATADSVCAIVKGKNFCAPLENVTFNCSSNFIVSDINKQIIDDETMYVDLQIPQNTKHFEVTAQSEVDEVTSIFEVNEYDVRTGDYVLKDNRIVRQEYITELTDSEKEKIFGIITLKDSGEPVILGLQQGENLKWTHENTINYGIKFSRIITEVSDGQWDEDKRTYYDYKFIGDVDGSDNWEYICSVDPEGTQDTAINYPVFNYANNYGTTAGLTGTDFEAGWYVPSVKELFDIYENKTVIQASIDVVGRFIGNSSFWSSSQSASYNDYAYRVYFYSGSVSSYIKYDTNNVFVLQAFTPELFTNYEYPEATITSVEIPVAGEGYTGELPVKIKGENLKGNKITCDDVTFSNVTYIDNTIATATITCTGFVGESTITVTSGLSSATGTVKVVEAEKCFTVGDILFTDGTIIKADKIKNGVPDELLSKAFSVIGAVSYNGAIGLGIGLQTKTCAWASWNTIGYNTKFIEIITKVFGEQRDEETNKYYGYKFSGDIDGSDNWDYICSVDPEGTQDASTNYPMFNFANNYGTTAGLTGSDYENGWYVPSAKELFDIYENKTVIQSSLNIVQGFSFKDVSYWCSSQYASYNDIAHLVDFNDGNVSSVSKDCNNNVFVLQAFNSELFNNYE